MTLQMLIDYFNLFGVQLCLGEKLGGAHDALNGTYTAFDFFRIRNFAY